MVNVSNRAVPVTSDERMDWVDVCALDDLVPWYGSGALVGGRQVALFRVGKDIYAIDNYDPIGKANVLARGIVGDIGEELVVASPLYKQHYSLKTGQCLEYPDIRVGAYAVRVAGNRVQVGVRLNAV